MLRPLVKAIEELDQVEGIEESGSPAIPAIIRKDRIRIDPCHLGVLSREPANDKVQEAFFVPHHVVAPKPVHVFVRRHGKVIVVEAELSDKERHALAAHRVDIREQVAFSGPVMAGIEVTRDDGEVMKHGRDGFTSGAR